LEGEKVEVDACECMTAVGIFAGAVMEVSGRTLTSRGMDAIYAALTKAEKLCGHVKAMDVRSMLDDVRDDPSMLDDFEGEYHDHITTQLVLDLAREMGKK